MQLESKGRGKVEKRKSESGKRERVKVGEKVKSWKWVADFRWWASYTLSSSFVLEKVFQELKLMKVIFFLSSFPLLSFFFSSSFSLLLLFFPFSPLTKLANHFSFSSTRIPLTSSSFFLSACDLMYPSERRGQLRSYLILDNLSRSNSLLSFLPSFLSTSISFRRDSSGIHVSTQVCKEERDSSNETDLFHRLVDMKVITSRDFRDPLPSHLLTNSHSTKKLNPFLLFDSERNPFSN